MFLAESCSSVKKIYMVSYLEVSDFLTNFQLGQFLHVGEMTTETKKEGYHGFKQNYDV